MILVGCQSESSVEQIVPKAESNKATQFEQTPLSLADNELGFERSHGWLDEETILYSASKGQASQLFSYHVPTGKKVLLYTLEGAISEVSISPEKEYILTSSANGDDMEFLMLSSAGKQVFSFDVQAMEISFSWNEFQEGLLLVESFDEDWYPRGTNPKAEASSAVCPMGIRKSAVVYGLGSRNFGIIGIFEVV